jgi:hypothetical protein
MIPRTRKLAGRPVLEEPDGDVALVTSDVEFVRNGGALVGELAAHGSRRLRPASTSAAPATLSLAVFSGCVRFEPSR